MGVIVDNCWLSVIFVKWVGISEWMATAGGNVTVKTTTKFLKLEKKLLLSERQQ